MFKIDVIHGTHPIHLKSVLQYSINGLYFPSWAANFRQFYYCTTCPEGNATSASTKKKGKCTFKLRLPLFFSNVPHWAKIHKKVYERKKLSWKFFLRVFKVIILHLYFFNFCKVDIWVQFHPLYISFKLLLFFTIDYENIIKNRKKYLL